MMVRGIFAGLCCPHAESARLLPTALVLPSCFLSTKVTALQSHSLVMTQPLPSMASSDDVMSHPCLVWGDL